MDITEIQLNYDRRDKFGQWADATDKISWWRDAEHKKSCVRKGLSFLRKEHEFSGTVAMHVMFADNASDKRYCYNVTCDREDREFDTFTIRLQECFPPYSIGEWYRIGATAFRKRLYVMCKEV